METSSENKYRNFFHVSNLFDIFLSSLVRSSTMTKVLGLDMGSNSIGWALINEEQKEIIATGVRIFQQGVMDIGTAKEKSKNAARREARQLRRQHYRRRMRKHLLRRFLVRNQMCPAMEGDIKNWFRLNPYELRHRAINEPLTLMELGRIFYHLAQHRGFLSNRKAEREDEGKIFDGKADSGTRGINELKEILEKTGQTLGSYLYSISYRDREPYTLKERIRNRYTLRQMYQDEFQRIWEYQKQFHPELTDELWNSVGFKKSPGGMDGFIFFQRPLRSQRHTLGKCTFESRKTYSPSLNKTISIGKSRAHCSHPDFEEFRALQFINSIRYGQDQPLDEQQRSRAREHILLKPGSINFSDLQKKIGLEHELCNYDGAHKIPGSPTTAGLVKLLGRGVFERNKHELWNCFIFYSDNEKLIEKLKRDYALDEKKAGQVKKIRLDQTYSSLSLKAIRNILPFLRKGYIYNEAVILGGVLNAFGRPRWEQLADDQVDFIETNVGEIIGRSHRLGETLELLKDFLQSEFQLEPSDLSKLYHHSQTGAKNQLLDTLPLPENVRNPIVQQALYELRKLVNAIIVRYGRPDIVKVEMARELKLPAKMRQKIWLDNRRRQEQNDEAREEVTKYGLRASRNNIQKYILWKEIRERSKNGLAVCPYTGKTIGIRDLFDDNQFQIEHIIPYSISLDDSLANKTLCDAAENQAKGNKTPFEYYGHDEVFWKAMVARAFKLLPYEKAKRFVSESHDDLDGFISRQLNDTRYISREAKEYLGLVIPKVQVMPGNLTATLRRKWGLNSILSGDDEVKTRDDHRHHAVDALTIACTRPYFLNELSRLHARGQNGLHDSYPLPWEGFTGQAQRAILSILVSHRKNNPVLTRISRMIRKDNKTYKSEGWAARGELHKETIFGKHTDRFGNEYYHVRKPLDSISKKAQVDKIADPYIQSLVRRRIEATGVDISQAKYTVKPGTFFKKDEESGKRIPLVFLKNRRGEDVPLYKVRLRETLNKARPLKSDGRINQFVNPRNNHHISVYVNSEGEYREEVVTLWEAVERKRKGVPVFSPAGPGEEVMAILQENAMFTLLKDGERRLYRVQKISEGYYVFREHKAATIDNDQEMMRIASFSALSHAKIEAANISILGSYH